MSNVMLINKVTPITLVYQCDPVKMKLPDSNKFVTKSELTKSEVASSKKFHMNLVK